MCWWANPAGSPVCERERLDVVDDDFHVGELAPARHDHADREVD